MSSFLTFLASFLLLLRLGSAQVVGTYVLETKGYHMAFDVFEKGLVYFQFQCIDATGQPMGEMLSDGPYNLTRSYPSGEYKIDFEDTFEGIAHWYNSIRFESQFTISPERGDLSSLYYVGSDDVRTVFLGKPIFLKRVALELSTGRFRFPYKNASSFDGIIVDYTVHRDSTVQMWVECKGITTNYWSFPLVRKDDIFGFTAYVVHDGSRSVAQFREEVRKVCPYTVYPGDYAYLIFATRSTILTEAGESRIALERK